MSLLVTCRLDPRQKNVRILYPFGAQPELFWSPINSMEDVVADEQFHAGGGVVYVPTPDGASVPMVATPADFSATPCDVRGCAPALGEHTEDVLAERRANRAR